MPIKASLRNLLLNHITECEFNPTDTTTCHVRECWTMECPAGHTFSSTIANLKQSLYKHKAPVCPDCKYNERLAKFEERSNVTIIGESRIQCNDCDLTYHHADKEFYNIFKCCCKRTTRISEHLLYSALHNLIPSRLGKEYTYVDCHKCDIVIKTKSKNFYIEIDENGHFSTAGKAADAVLTARFLETRQGEDIIIRVESNLVLQDPNDIAERIIDLVLEDNTGIAVVCYSNRYNHLNVPQEMLRVIT